MRHKTTLTLTAEEIDIIKTALNSYSVEMMDKSTTWAILGTYGKEDYYHRMAYKINDLWSRFYDAAKRLAKRETVTTTAE